MSQPLRIVRHEPTPDDIHEALIQATYERWEIGGAAWTELCDLIAARSPAQVRRMERARGLA